MLHTCFLWLWQAGAPLYLRCLGFSLWRLVLLRSMAPAVRASVLVANVLNCSVACESSPNVNQRCVPCIGRQTYPLYHQKSPSLLKISSRNKCSAFSLLMKYKPRFVCYYSCSPNIELIVYLSWEPGYGKPDKLSQKLENTVLTIPTDRLLIYAKAGYIFMPWYHIWYVMI